VISGCRRIYVHLVRRFTFARGKALPRFGAGESGTLARFDGNFDGFEGIVVRVTEAQDVRYESGTGLFHLWLVNFI
jgi:hypothetical protein